VRSVFILKQSLPTLQPDKVDMAVSECNAEELKHSLCYHLNNSQKLLLQLNYIMLLVAFMTFVGPRIIIYFYSKTNQIHNISNLFYFGTTLYMFRTVSPSIIRSLRLYIQHHTIQVMWLLASKQPHNLCDIYLMLYVQSYTPDDGWKDRPKYVE
jgi:hypothetical protein